MFSHLPIADLSAELSVRYLGPTFFSCQSNVHSIVSTFKWRMKKKCLSVDVVLINYYYSHVFERATKKEKRRKHRIKPHICISCVLIDIYCWCHNLCYFTVYLYCFLKFIIVSTILWWIKIFILSYSVLKPRTRLSAGSVAVSDIFRRLVLCGYWITPPPPERLCGSLFLFYRPSLRAAVAAKLDILIAVDIKQRQTQLIYCVAVTHTWARGAYDGRVF